MPFICQSLRTFIWGLRSMKIKCLHGYFIFEETGVGQVAAFMAYSKLELVRRGPVFVLSALEDAPRYSIKGKDLLGFTATATFEGEPWEVFEANGVVWDFLDEQIKPIASITNQVSIKQVGAYFHSNGLILPGSLTDEAQRVKAYAAWFSMNRQRFLYSEVSYV